MGPQFAALPATFEHMSEEFVYGKLKECPNDWIIIPSVTPQSSTGNQREIDYVLVIPGSPKIHRGAIICLEVKGGHYEIDENKKWYGFAGGVKQPMNSPMAEAFHKWNVLKGWLKTILKDNPPSPFINLDNIGFDYAVAFPNFRLDDPDTLRVFDKDIINNNQLIEKLVAIVNNIANRQHENSTNKRFLFLRPTEAMLLRDRMLPSGERQIYITSGDVGSTHRELATLTGEQFSNLNLVQDNDGNLINRRILFEGGAGTGKTMLAMELARRRTKAGDRVAFILSTPTVAEWAHEGLKDEVELVGPLTYVLCGGDEEIRARNAEYVEEKKQNEIWYPFDLSKQDKILEDFALDATNMMTERGLQWDYLIVDELQYFQFASTIPILDLGLKGGLRRGNWAMFGDFKTQNLNTTHIHMLDNSEQGLGFDSTILEDTKLSLQKSLPVEVEEGDQVYIQAPELTINCRNSFEIATAAAQVVGEAVNVDSNLQRKKVLGVKPRIRFWADQAELKSFLAEEFRQLDDAGISPEYVKMSYDKYLDIFNELDELEVTSGLWYLRYFDEEKELTEKQKKELTKELTEKQKKGLEKKQKRRLEKTVCAYWILDFAGMESDVIVLIVDEIDEGVSKADPSAISYYSQLFYVGISRAKTSLIILSHKSHEDLLDRIRLQEVS